MSSSASTGVLSERGNALRGVELGVAWQSPWREFRESVRDFVAGPRPLKDSELVEPLTLRVDWIRGKVPGKGLVGSALWHVFVVTLLVLPIWGFLPQPERTLAPVQIESTLYYVPPDLPKIELPKKAAHAAAAASAGEKPVAQAGADALTPRQTILSIPVQVTHPRQTLIQPDAPQSAPKIVQQMPNIVQWAQTEPERPRLQLAPTAAAPKLRERAVRDLAAPTVATDKSAATSSIDLSAQPSLKAPLEASVAKAQQRQARTENEPAPDVSAASGDANLHRIIALSATPAPPAAAVNVPNGNLAARIAISPEGTKPGTPGGAEHGPEAADAGHGNAARATGANGGAGASTSSLPAAISVSGGIAPSGNHAGPLNLHPTPPPTYTSTPHRTAAEIAAIDPSLPPEKILSGKEVYTMDVNLPNLTSVAGSWVLYFAQLDDDQGPLHPQGKLSSPVPVEKADPKYPPDAINENVDGEVVLYAIIRKNGTVDSIQLVHGIDPRLDKSAMEALARWKFTPGARDGMPVDLEAVINIPFRFRQRDR